MILERMIETAITQAPFIALLLFLLQGREKRVDTLEKRIDECLDARKSDNPHQYTYPPK